MVKGKRIRLNTLGIKLTVYALVSILAAALVFYGVSLLFDALMSDENALEGLIERDTQRMVASVQKYVDENALSLNDVYSLNKIQGYDTLMIALYSDGKLIYDPYGMDISEWLGVEGDNSIIFGSDVELFDVKFSDGTAQMYVWNNGFFIWYYRISDFTGGALAFVTFVTLFTIFIRKKLKYILQLEKELHILEGGDLNYQITVRGGDELSNLAKSIDDMRLSFIERQDGEARAIRANRSLVTAMSHDIRTPLTALMGYLELIENKQYESEEDKERFIQASLSKVRLIKQMTDELFEYSLYGGGDYNARLESMDAYELLSQLLTEYGFELESGGFTVESDIQEFSARARFDASLMARVFDNMMSNIRKYAAKDKAIRLRLSSDGKKAYVIIENDIRRLVDAQSSHIGIKTCENILKQHGGEFIVTRTQNVFTVCMKIPFEKVM